MGYLFIAIYIAIILMVIEISTILFILTGLEKHVARFQAISMLTGTGFTTGESELIIKHPIRRKLGAFLILFGAFSLAVIISSVSGILSEDFHTKEITWFAALMLLAVIILKFPSLQKKLASTINKELVKTFDLVDLPISDVFLRNEDDYFIEVHIHEESDLIGKTLKDELTEEDDINVLFIKRGDVIIRHQRLIERINEGDQILLYGDKECLQKMFQDELEAREELNEKSHARKSGMS